MTDLLALQNDFARALRDPDATADTCARLAGDADSTARRLAIYRANMTAAAEKALSAAFPVARQLLGDDFSTLAHAYLRAHPSASGDLGEFGDRLPEFASIFEATHTLPWLPDLARLEWAAHLAYGAVDAPTWDASALATIGEADQSRLRFTWSPGLTVIESDWPIVRLWTLHQPGSEEDFAVDWKVGERALVAREGFVVTVQALGAGEATFLARSLAGATLGESVDAALHAEPAFDLGTLLARLLAAGHCCGFTLESTS